MESVGYSSYTVPLDSEMELTIISLNTVMYSPGPTKLGPDPYSQFAWLDHTLAALDASADAQLKRVYISAHIPPAYDSYSLELQWEPQYIAKYLGVVGRYMPTY
jgi:hypothetical protein